MFTMVTNFFNTSLAALSIYDILVITLFILAIVLSIISGIIIISARVKKINTELDKSKNIQNINEKIIQNRLDLIINKLNSSESLSHNQHLLPLNNITNNNIKQAINTSTVEKSNNQSANEIIKLPPPSSNLTSTYNDVNHEEITSTDEVKSSLNNNNSQIEEGIDNSTTKNSDNNCFLEDKTNNIINTSISNSNVDIQNIDITTDKSQITHEPELITVDNNNIPETDDVINQEDEETFIDVKDNNNKSSEITINYFATEDLTETEDNQIKENTSFEEAPSIPLAPNNNNIENNSSVNENPVDNNEQYQNIDLQHEQNYHKEEIADHDFLNKNNNLKIINETLNKLCIFSNKEKFNITNNISKDGQFINCWVSKQELPLNYKELNRQLLLQRFIYKYNYSEDDIEIAYPVELNNSITKYADIVIFDEDNQPLIVALIAIPNKKKRFKLLKALVNNLNAPFAVWSDGENIMYYKNNYGTLEEVTFLPRCNEEIEDTLSVNDRYANPNINNSNMSFNNNNSSYKNSTYKQQFIDKENDENYTNEPLPNKVSNFSKDVYNIYRNQPYSLSKEYQQIIEKYRHLRNKFLFNQNQEYYQIKEPIPFNINRPVPISIDHSSIDNFNKPYGNITIPQPIPYNNMTGNFLINKYRDSYMNRNYNCYNTPLHQPLNQNFGANNNPNFRNFYPYRNNFMLNSMHNNNYAVRPQFYNRQVTAPINYNNNMANNNVVEPTCPPNPMANNENMQPMPPMMANIPFPSRPINMPAPIMQQNYTSNMPYPSHMFPFNKNPLNNNYMRSNINHNTFPPRGLPLKTNEEGFSHSYNTPSNAFKSYKDSLSSRNITENTSRPILEPRLFKPSFKFK